MNRKDDTRYFGLIIPSSQDDDAALNLTVTTVFIDFLLIHQGILEQLENEYFIPNFAIRFGESDRDRSYCACIVQNV